jgi:hypothetical protein
MDYIDLSYLSKLLSQDWLYRLFTRTSIQIRRRETATLYNEFKVRYSLAFTNSFTCKFRLGRRIVIGREVAGVSLGNTFFSQEGVFEPFLDLELLVEYQNLSREGSKPKKYENDYNIDEVPARLEPSFWKFRMSKQCFALLDEAYGELLGEIIFPIEHSELHTDNEGYDL